MRCRRPSTRFCGPSTHAISRHGWRGWRRPMPRAGHKRLARLAQHAPPDAVQEACCHRVYLRWLVLCGWLIHDMAAAAGIDTETIAALRKPEQASAELAALGETA